MRIAIITISFALILVIGWVLVYPSSGDPRNIKYVLWKVGLYQMNLDVATGTMIGDPGRDKLVVGKTKAQIRDKFGLLLMPSEASQYLRGCYQSSPWKDRDVLFIRNSSWMIVFDGDSATKLVLMKGC
jgi:hypothetical protein